MTFGYLSTENHWPQRQIYIYIYMYDVSSSFLSFTFHSVLTYRFAAHLFHPKLFPAHFSRPLRWGISAIYPFTHLPISPVSLLLTTIMRCF